MQPNTSDESARDPVEVACELNDAAVESFHAGRAEEAEELFRRALSLLEESEGEDSPDVANVLSSLGAVGEQRCDYSGAESCFARAAAIMDAHEDSDDEDVRRLRLQTLSDLGRIRRILGRYEEAEPLIKRSIALAEETFGTDSVETAGALNDLGMLYKFNGRFEEAEPLYRRALEIFERAYGPDHYEVAVNLNNLAMVLDARGEAEEAEALLKRALRIKERLFGAENVAWAMTANNLGVLYREQSPATKPNDFSRPPSRPSSV
jgi:tetratricopeptide (TPR) repeat protein